MPAGDRDHI
jgi:hypothetical protein